MRRYLGPGSPAVDLPLRDITSAIIAAFLAVYHKFGYGFLESLYRRALAIELRARGLSIAEAVRYEVFHRGHSVGVYRADMVVESSVIVETKTGLVPDPVAPVQLLNYLRVSGVRVGLVLHAGPRPTIRRVVNGW